MTNTTHAMTALIQSFKHYLANLSGKLFAESRIEPPADLPIPISSLTNPSPLTAASSLSNSSALAAVYPLTNSPPPDAYKEMINSDQYYSFLREESNKSFHILVAADNETSLGILADHLTSYHYNVIQATTSQDVLQITDTNQDIDLILLDFMKSELSSIEVCREIRRTHAVNRLPIIILGMNKQMDDLLKAFKVGANDYMTKPAPKEELLSRIKNHLRVAQFTKTYHRFVPHEFVEFMGKKQVMGTTLCEPISTKMGVLFADISSFTLLSEKMTAQENFKFLNAYLGRITPVIREYNGFIEKHMGDSTMALFSGPASDAIDGAIAIQRTIRHYNTHRAKSDYQSITVGIGLHYGDVTIGMIGESNRFKSAVISPVVKVAANLKELSKLYGASILVSEQTISALKKPGRYHFRFLDKIQVKGQQKAIKVFEVLDGEAEETMERRLQTKKEFDTALAYYYQKEFCKAKEILKNVLKIDPTDSAARLYHQRLTHRTQF